jgi:glycosyltransferase involved in cell wall biosynthesis
MGVGQVLAFGDGPSTCPRVSIVIPFFNEAASLPELFVALERFVRSASAQRELRFETIFIDDGSDDSGGDVIKWLCAGGAATMDVRLIRLSRNFGKEVALTAGLSVVSSDAVVFMDADLQHPVDVIESFLDGWLTERFDVVYGYQRRDRPESAFQRAGRRLFYRLLSAEFERPLLPDAGDFRLMSRTAYQALQQFGERQRLMKGLYGWIGFRQKGVAFVAPQRAHGATKFSPVKLLGLALEGITSFSVAPLRLAVWAGATLGLASAAYGVWTIIEKVVLGIATDGYATIVVAITMIGAAQLVFLGIIGEYLGKVLIEVKGRPLFIIESDQRFSMRLASAVRDSVANSAPSS